MTPQKLYQEIVKAHPNISVAQLRRLGEFLVSASDSTLAQETGKMPAQPEQDRRQLKPPAGLKAREAISVLIAFVRDEKGNLLKLSPKERGSFSALIDALDRQFGEGYAEALIEQINNMPNGSFSLHYPR